MAVSLALLAAGLIGWWRAECVSRQAREGDLLSAVDVICIALIFGSIVYIIASVW